MNLLITQSFLFLKSVLPGSAHGDKPAADADGAGAALKGRPSPLRHALTPAKARHRGTAASRGSRGPGLPQKATGRGGVHSPGRRVLRHLHTRDPNPRGGGWGIGQEEASGGCSREAGICCPRSLAWVSPCYFREKVNATPGGSSKEPRARQMRLKQNVPSIHE